MDATANDVPSPYKVEGYVNTMYIALDKALYSIKRQWNFSYFSKKTHFVGTH